MRGGERGWGLIGTVTNSPPFGLVPCSPVNSPTVFILFYSFFAAAVMNSCAITHLGLQADVMDCFTVMLFYPWVLWPRAWSRCLKRLLKRQGSAQDRQNNCTRNTRNTLYSCNFIPATSFLHQFNGQNYGAQHASDTVQLSIGCSVAATPRHEPAQAMTEAMTAVRNRE